jgi:phenylpropionate dioxygenase-like ring-hydroxylating dioxygenase large terminal subunit
VLIHQLPARREYWYPVGYAADVTDEPQLFRIFSEDYVLWRPVPGGSLRAARDECPHRSASLSQGWVADGCLTCPYHAWSFDAEGTCVRIPSADPGTPIPRRAQLDTILAGERYGLVWVCVGVPRADIPTLAEAEAPGFTLIHEMKEVWAASAPRVIDNALDVTHVPWVHRGTIGYPDAPRLGELSVESEGLSLRYRTSQVAKVTPQLSANTGITAATTVRVATVELVNPLVYRGALEYVDNGLIHVLLKAATPIDDRTTLFFQFVARNDNPDADKQRGIIAVDKAVQAEDRAILERTKPDFPVGITEEVHTRADRMTIEYRRILGMLASESGMVASSG